MVRVIGLMSGSSLDGLDIACVDFSFEDQWKFDIVAAETIEYSSEWKEKLMKSTELDARSYVLLDVNYGHYLGRCVNEFLDRFHLPSTNIDLVASHGHTVFHEPWNGMTAQIGDGAAIAAETGLKVVSNLRSIDVALAGQGAPIVPMGEKHLFKTYRLLLNIGGIANLTDQEFSIAFDICPANRILNKLMSEYLHEEFDRDGQISSTGHVDFELFEKLNQFDYYRKSYPKSLSNSFGLEKIFPVLTTSKIPVADLLRTYVEHIVEQIVRALEMIIEKEKKGRSIYENCRLLVTGGGGHNRFLIERLTMELKRKFSIDIECPEKKVIDFKEALIMAFLGLLRFENRCNVLSSVTGARRDSIDYRMLWRNLRRFASTSASFTYPQRLVRSPTAILEALNSCVDIDGQNPAYQYMDDPFLIPTSAYEKRQYSLSKASGKKAARWIMDRYPDAFFYNTAVPPIPSYFPSYSFTEKDFIDIDEKTIYKLIDWNLISKAYEIYKKCLSEQIAVSDACKYALFDVLCIYNSENPSEIIATEEIWYRADLNENSGSKKTWKENGFAEQMFEHLKQNATDEQKFRLYNSLVCGLFKFQNVEKAMATIEEMRQNQISLNLSTYNYLLRATSSLKDTHEARWQFLLDHLREMKENGISPTLQTFHAVLYTLRRNSMSEHGPTLAMSVLNEMRQCSIEPSLGTWAHVIMIFYPNDQVGSETKILPQILDEVEKQFKKNGNQLEWRDLDDSEFFFNAMFKATLNCRDIDLAKRIHRFFMMGSNIRFITNNIKEQMYYTNLFRLLFRLDTPDQVMPLWESVVPNIYSPSSNILEDFIEFLSVWNQKEYYVRLWSDLLVMGLLDSRQNNHRLIERYFTLLTRVDQGELNENQIQQYTNIARQMIKRFPLDAQEEEQEVEKKTEKNDEQQQDKNSRRPVPVKFQYNGQLLSHLICLLSQGNDLESSFALYDYYVLHRSTMVNPLNERTLMSLLKLAVKEKNIDRSFNVLQTINEHSYNCLGDALDLVNRNISLTHKDRQYLRTIQQNATVDSAHQVKLI